MAPQLLFGPEAENAYQLTLGRPITAAWFVIGLGVYLYLRAALRAELDVMAGEIAQGQA